MSTRQHIIASTTHRPMRTPAHVVVALLVAMAVCVPAKDKETDDVWRVRENLVQRLSGERYNIGTLQSELARVSDVLGDVRNLEVFPPAVTHLTDESLLNFDKSIEVVEKKHKQIAAQVTALSPPLVDAVGILRELVAGQPVKEMFDVIETGDVQRLEEMIAVKHQIDSLWRDVDHLLSAAGIKMGIMPQQQAVAQSGGLEAEFFQIVRSNLGLLSEQYYDKLNVIKDSLAARANLAQSNAMLHIELARIRTYLDNGSALLASEKLTRLKRRFTESSQVSSLVVLKCRADLARGAYPDVLKGMRALPDSGRNVAELVPFRVQTWYALGDYRSIWSWARSFDFAKVSGTRRNLLLWLSLESALALSQTDNVARMAGQADQTAPYFLHVMHALARSFAQKSDWATAQSVLERALQFKPVTADDNEARTRLVLASAQARYELGDYQKSTKQFFELLSSEDQFEEALFGIVWCYVRTGQYDKAETTLRKLINQSPNSPRAVDAIMVLAKRFVSKAQYEWKKTTFLTKEEARLDDLLAKARSAQALPGADSSDIAVAKGVAQLNELRARLAAQKRESPEAIQAYFDNALTMCRMVQEFYQSGTFEEVVLSGKRETMLQRLDSLLLQIKGEGVSGTERARMVAKSRDNLRAIKAMVAQSRVLDVETQLDRYRWEGEFLDWRKEGINSARATVTRRIAAETDTSRLAALRAQQKAVAARMDSLLTWEDRLNVRRQDELLQACSKALSTPLTPRDESYLRYHLAEVYYTRENAVFSQAFTRYDRELARYDSLMEAFHNGSLVGMPTPPQRPVLDHSQSMSQYRTICSRFRESDLVPAALYSMAWCFSDMGQADSAVMNMQTVADLYPDSRYTPQAWMFIGEHAFDRSKLEDAATAYQQVMKYPESQWFDDALYKFAWTQYRLSNPEKAISSFLALVDLGSKHATGKSLLEKESMDYIAISFSEADISGEKGLMRAAKFIQRFGDAEKGTRILHRLATVYKEQGRLDMAERTYKTLLRMFPDYPQNPAVEKELLAVAERRQGAEEAFEAKMAYHRKYCRASSWARAQTDTSAVAVGDSLSASVLYDAALSSHQMALQGSDKSGYLRAAGTYEEYIRSFPTSAKANECHYNLAEIMFSVGEYKRAAEEYIAVSRRYPDSRYRETAAWNAIVASQNLLKMEQKNGGVQ